MSSHWDGLDDSWGQRKERQKRSTRLQWAAFVRILLTVFAISIGTGVGAIAGKEEPGGAVSHLLGGLVFGLVGSFLSLIRILFLVVYQSIQNDLHDEKDDINVSASFQTAVIIGAWVIGALGAASGLLDDTTASQASFIGALCGGGIAFVLAYVISFLSRMGNI